MNLHCCRTTFIVLDAQLEQAGQGEPSRLSLSKAVQFEPPVANGVSPPDAAGMMWSCTSV